MLVKPFTVYCLVFTVHFFPSSFQLRAFFFFELPASSLSHTNLQNGFQKIPIFEIYNN